LGWDIADGTSQHLSFQDRTKLSYALTYIADMLSYRAAASTSRIADDTASGFSRGKK